MAIAGKRHGRARTWQHVAMAQKKCVEEAEERLNILPTSFALQMSSQKNERGLPQTDFAGWKRA